MGKTALIVDDEAFVRMEIRERIDWEHHGYSNLVEADNGEKALAYCRNSFPDLILTDIRMPVMDGIVLCSELKKLNRHAKIVVLSSYIDFEYVREALKIGVLDYLPKHEMDNRSMVSVFEKIKLESSYEQMPKWMDSLGKPVYLRRFIMAGSDEGAEGFDFEAFRFNQTCSDMLLIEVDMEYIAGLNDEGRCNAPLAPEFSRAIYALLDEALQEYTAEYTELYENKFWVIFQMKRLWSEHSKHHFTIEAIHNLSTKLRGSHLSFYFSLYYQLYTGTVRDLPLFFMDMQKTARKKIGHRHEITRICDINPLSAPIVQGMLGIRQLQASLQQHDHRQVEAAVQTIWMKEAPQLSETELSKLYCKVVDCFMESILCRSDRTMARHLLNTALTDFKTFEGIVEWFRLIADRLLNTGHYTVKGVVDHEKLRSIMIYIQNHPQEDLGLKRMADLFGMNKNYLSEIFKQKLGINISKYVLQIRMEHAMELLTETALPVKEVSKAAGYDDTGYFIKMFVKYGGISPSNYRKMRASMCGKELTDSQE